MVDLAVEIGGDLGRVARRHVADVELVLAGRVREVRDLPAVRREPRGVLPDARGTGEVARHRLLVGESQVEDVPAGGEDDGLPVPRDVHGLDVLRRVDPAVLQPPVVGGDLYRHLAGPAPGHVQAEEIAVLDVDVNNRG